MAAFTEEQMKDFSIKNWYDLSGQVAVVTGGATGLGLAITRCLVSAGAKVAVVASRAPELVADTLAEFGGKAVYYQFNITDTDHAQELADKITAEQGPVSILVNNAGNHCKKFIWDMTVDDYKRVLDVHLVGARTDQGFCSPDEGAGSWPHHLPGQHDQLHRPAPGGRLLHRKGRLSGPDPHPDR